MNLKDFLPSQGEKKSYYWALVIEPGWIQAGIWEVVNEKAVVLSVSPSTAWETEAEILGAADAALSASVQNLPEEVGEPSETVFGVTSSWVQDGQIKPEYLNIIKKICSELSLTPSGFVVIPEAIAHLSKSEEETPVNAIILGIGKENIEISVFQLGVLSGTTSVARSVSIPDDVMEGLTRFSSPGPLPSRFLIYDGKEVTLEEDRQSLLSADWVGNEKIKFLHTPKVEVIDPERKVLAVCLAGASEIANVSQISKVQPEKEEVPVETTAGEEGDKPKPSDFGFVVGEDISNVEAVAKEPIATSAPTPADISSPQQPINKKLGASFSSLFKKFPGFPLSFPSFSLSSGGRRLPLILLIVLILVIVGLVAWVYLPRAEVTVFVSPKKISEAGLELAVDTSGDGDLSNKIIKGTDVELEVSGDKTRPTTGTKTVGEKARGVVKIANGTSQILNLSTGTQILSSGDLKFTLDKAASVSAALSPTSPGTTNIEVTAGDIGSSYNLSKDERFSVSNYPKSEVDAVAVASFTGGSSREISAVSEDDLGALEEDLTAELIEKAESQISSEVSEDELLIQESLIPTVVSREFGNRVGDEASVLKLSLDLKVEGIVVKKSDLHEVAKKTLEGEVPDGYVLREQQLTFVFEKPEDESNDKYLVDVTANLLPEFNSENISKKISGKSRPAALAELSKISGFSRAQIIFRPNLPGFLGRVPFILNHISLEVTADE